ARAWPGRPGVRDARRRTRSRSRCRGALRREAWSLPGAAPARRSPSLLPRPRRVNLETADPPSASPSDPRPIDVRRTGSALLRRAERHLDRAGGLAVVAVERVRNHAIEVGLAGHRGRIRPLEPAVLTEPLLLAELEVADLDELHAVLRRALDPEATDV